MSKPKRITWKQMQVSTAGENLPNTLNRLNFQPGKFHIVPTANPSQVLIVYVAEELPL